MRLVRWPHIVVTNDKDHIALFSGSFGAPHGAPEGWW